jgi:serralysin
MKRLIIFVFAFISVASYSQFSKRIPSCTAALGEYRDNFFARVDTTKGRGMADFYRLWDNGDTIKVKFMNGGSTMMRNKVMGYVKQWEQYANIKFLFLPDNAPVTNVRVRLGTEFGHNSKLGTDCNTVPQNMQTVNFDTSGFLDYPFYRNDYSTKGPVYQSLLAKGIDLWKLDDEHIKEAILKSKDIHWDWQELKGTVLHEFGHVLGLFHEQSYPGAIKWNKADSVYAYYQNSQGWGRQMTDYQVFRVNDQFYSNGTKYDPASIMQYSVEPWLTLDGFSVPENYELSAGDKALIAVLYPKNKKQSDVLVPKARISNFTKLVVKPNLSNTGLNISPTFDLKTNDVLGDVYFVAKVLFQENGKYYYLHTDSTSYSWHGDAAVYYLMRLLPNSKVSYNKLKPDFEIYLPFDKIPDIKGKTIKIEFSVYLDDKKNGQLDKQMYFSNSNPVSLPVK